MSLPTKYGIINLVQWNNSFQSLWVIFSTVFFATTNCISPTPPSLEKKNTSAISSNAYTTVKDENGCDCRQIISGAKWALLGLSQNIINPSGKHDILKVQTIFHMNCTSPIINPNGNLSMVTLGQNKTKLFKCKSLWIWCQPWTNFMVRWSPRWHTITQSYCLDHLQLKNNFKSIP